MHSDHALILFTIKGASSGIGDTISSKQGVYFKWDVDCRDCKDQFRPGIIGILLRFNDIFNSNVSKSIEIEQMVLDFSHLVSDVADPLFKHTFSNGNNRSYLESKWFDAECAQAKRILYIDALAIFNNNKSTESRFSLCNKKTFYKNLIRKKKRANKIKMTDELTRLKNSKPKDFWKHFKNKRETTDSQFP
jgi:hypothetical protein